MVPPEGNNFQGSMRRRDCGRRYAKAGEWVGSCRWPVLLLRKKSAFADGQRDGRRDAGVTLVLYQNEVRQARQCGQDSAIKSFYAVVSRCDAQQSSCTSPAWHYPRQGNCGARLSTRPYFLNFSGQRPVNSPSFSFSLSHVVAPLTFILPVSSIMTT